ncbi:MAG: OsmC family peroxiredoxin [Planctomycetota bacterium]|nr:MAG: OsmC family peroxiredoxin [Planctomycetota bacterium]
MSETPAGTHEWPNPNQVVARIERQRYTTRIVAGRHNLVADEPESAGGADQGPTPYGLLLASLGACTAMTLRMYADRKGWPLEAVEVRLRHCRLHAQDCEECESTEGMVDRIDRALLLTGPLSAEQRARLVEIAQKCPVHRTLTSETVIRTKEVQGDAP